MTASFEGHSEVVRQLVEAKANINTQDKVFISSYHQETHYTTHQYSQCYCLIKLY